MNGGIIIMRVGFGGIIIGALVGRRFPEARRILT